MSIMDVWFNVNMSVLVIVGVMMVLDSITHISDEYYYYGMIGAGGIFFFAISGTLYFICSVVWGL